jgi:hypothetical protein
MPARDGDGVMVELAVTMSRLLSPLSLPNRQPGRSAVVTSSAEAARAVVEADPERPGGRR